MSNISECFHVKVPMYIFNVIKTQNCAPFKNKETDNILESETQHIQSQCPCRPYKTPQDSAKAS